MVITQSLPIWPLWRTARNEHSVVYRLERAPGQENAAAVLAERRDAAVPDDAAPGAVLDHNANEYKSRSRRLGSSLRRSANL